MLEWFRWLIQRGVNRVIETLGTGRGDTIAKSQRREVERDARASADDETDPHVPDLANLRRRSLSKLWRH